jgi:glucose-6-phosphate 1-dehydrogenase
MSSQIIPVDPFDYVVFGGTGDLSERKLLPALYHRQEAGQLTEPTRIIGASLLRRGRRQIGQGMG